VGSVLLGAVVPFTLVVMLPTNNRLLDSNLDKASPDAEALLARWARLHAVTSEWRAIASRTAKVPMHPGVEKILQQFDVRST
jgi:hypothetical protein